MTFETAHAFRRPSCPPRAACSVLLTVAALAFVPLAFVSLAFGTFWALSPFFGRWRPIFSFGAHDARTSEYLGHQSCFFGRWRPAFLIWCPRCPHLRMSWAPALLFRALAPDLFPPAPTPRRGPIYSTFPATFSNFLLVFSPHLRIMKQGGKISDFSSLRYFSKSAAFEKVPFYPCATSQKAQRLRRGHFYPLLNPKTGSDSHVSCRF